MYTDESEYSGETDDGGSTMKRMSPTTRQNFRQNVNIVVCLSAGAALLVFNIVGALIFLVAEKDNYDFSENSQISKCLQNLPIASKVTEEMKKKVSSCLIKSSRIDGFGKAIFFCWTLYSTVGYGNLYTHTTVGRFLTIIYALLMIPIYIAFKFEFGTFLAHTLVISFNQIGIELRALYNKLIRNLDRNQVHPNHHASPFHRDHLIFLTSILICSLSLLCSSTLFSFIENVSFANSIYFGVITTFLIGLGDIVPTNLLWFGGYGLFFLVSDVLSNQIFYFCQARIRFFLHCVARGVLLLRNDDEEYPLEATLSLHNVPVISSKCMPSLVLDCEKEELDKDEQLISPLTIL